MKLTLKQLIDSTTVPPKGDKSALAALATNDDIPAKTSYWIGKVLRRSESEVKDYNEARNKMLAKHGTLNEDGKSYAFTPEGMEAFGKEFDEFMATEIEFQGINTIPVESLGDARIAPAVTASLDWLITE